MCEVQAIIKNAVLVSNESLPIKTSFKSHGSFVDPTHNNKLILLIATAKRVTVLCVKEG